MVMPQNWLFLSSYKAFRAKLLTRAEWNLLARLGPSSFQTPMWDFNVQLFLCSDPNSQLREDHSISCLDVSDLPTANSKSECLVTQCIQPVPQGRQIKNPDARIIFDEISGELLSV